MATSSAHLAAYFCMIQVILVLSWPSEARHILQADAIAQAVGRQGEMTEYCILIQWSCGLQQFYLHAAFTFGMMIYLQCTACTYARPAAHHKPHVLRICRVGARV